MNIKMDRVYERYRQQMASGSVTWQRSPEGNLGDGGRGGGGGGEGGGEVGGDLHPILENELNMNHSSGLTNRFHGRGQGFENGFGSVGSGWNNDEGGEDGEDESISGGGYFGGGDGDYRGGGGGGGGSSGCTVRFIDGRCGDGESRKQSSASRKLLSASRKQSSASRSSVSPPPNYASSSLTERFSIFSLRSKITKK